MLSFMAGGQKGGKLKCMLSWFVSECFVWLGLDSFVKCVAAKGNGWKYFSWVNDHEIAEIYSGRKVLLIVLFGLNTGADVLKLH